MEGTITVLDGANVRHKIITTATKTKLAVVAEPMTMTTETGTHAYVLHCLLGGAWLVVEAILYMVGWIDRNQTEWVCLMEKQETMTQFAYDVLWIVSAYLNACILELTAMAEGDPGAHTPVPFQYLINDIYHGWYTGCVLPRSFHDILTVRAGRRELLALAAALPPPAPRTIGGEGRAGGGGGCRDTGAGGVIVPRGRRWNECNGEVIPNSHSI